MAGQAVEFLIGAGVDVNAAVSVAAPLIYLGPLGLVQGLNKL